MTGSAAPAVAVAALAAVVVRMGQEMSYAKQFRGGKSFNVRFAADGVYRVPEHIYNSWTNRENPIKVTVLEEGTFSESDIEFDLADALVKVQALVDGERQAKPAAVVRGDFSDLFPPKEVEELLPLEQARAATPTPSTTLKSALPTPSKPSAGEGATVKSI